MESGAISDAQISASSEWDPNHAAIQGRLNFKAGGGKKRGLVIKAQQSESVAPSGSGQQQGSEIFGHTGKERS